MSALKFRRRPANPYHRVRKQSLKEKRLIAAARRRSHLAAPKSLLFRRDSYMNSIRPRKVAKRAFVKNVKAVVHKMKGKNYKLVVDYNKQGNGVSNLGSMNPDSLFHANMTDHIDHEATGETTSTYDPVAAKALAIERRSSPSIYLTGFRMMYRFELANNTELDQFGEGYTIRCLLVKDKYDHGIPPGKEMFAHSMVYQSVRDAFGNENDHNLERINTHNKIGRNFDANDQFFDKNTKVSSALNTKRYTKLNEWTFNFKRRYVGDEQVQSGLLMHNFNMEKLTFEHKTVEASGTQDVIPDKRICFMMYYERKNGNDDIVTGFPPIKVKLHGFLYWKDEAPFQQTATDRKSVV